MPNRTKQHVFADVIGKSEVYHLQVQAEPGAQVTLSGLSLHLPLCSVFLSVGFILRKAAPLALGLYPATFKTSGKRVSLSAVLIKASQLSFIGSECRSLNYPAGLGG